MIPNEVLQVPEGPADSANEIIWQHPSRNVKISVPADLGHLLAERALHHFKAKSQSEIGGLLFGTGADDGNELNVIVTDAEFVPSEGALYNSTPNDLYALISAVAKHSQRADSVPIGYFRSHIQDGFSLSERDKQLVEQYLPKLISLSLLIRPYHMGVCMAGIFLWEDGRIDGERTEFELPLFVSDGDNTGYGANSGSSESAKIDQPVRATKEHEIAAPMPIALPRSAARLPRVSGPGKKVRKFPYLLTATAVCLCGLIPGGALYVYQRLHTNEPKPVVQETVHKSNAPSNSGLGLQVSRPAKGQFNITWDRNLPEGAQGGVLEILDGSSLQKLILDQTQVRIGKLTYFSTSADISFRLDVKIESGAVVAEYVRVLGPKTGTIRSAEAIFDAQKVRPIVGRDRSAAAAKAALSVPTAKTPEESSAASSILPPPVPISEISLPLTGSDNQVPLVLPPVSARSTEAATVSRNIKAGPDPKEKIASRPHGSVPQLSLPAPTGPVSIQPTPTRKVMPQIRQIMPGGVPYVTRIGIDVTVDKNGRVSEAHTTTAPNILTNACIAAAHGWRFTPASVGHQSVESSYSILFVFRPTVQ